MNIRRLAVASASALAIVGCGGPTPITPKIAPATSDLVGDPVVLERIETLTDCAAIQEQFDLAFNSSERARPGSAQHKADVAHMNAADNRLADLDCY